MTQKPVRANRREWVLNWLRTGFVAGTVLFAYFGLRSQWPAIVESAGETTPFRLLLSAFLVCSGLLGTAIIWRSILQQFGYEVPKRQGASIFFVGQLGKYIPGSVWSLGAQAEMARRLAIPVRVTVAVGLVFLAVNVLSAASFGAIGGLLGYLPWSLPDWLLWTGLLLTLAGLTSPALSWLGTRLAGSPYRLRISLRALAWILLTMVAVWFAYGAAMAVVLPAPDGAENPAQSWLVASVIAFTVSYAVGVIVIFAPAGVGAREATLIVLLTPAMGLPAATAVALLTRLVHTASDFLWALIAWGSTKAEINRD